MTAIQNKSEQIKFEQQLIADCIAGNEKAWFDFVDSYGRLIYKTIYKTLAMRGYKTKNHLVEELYNEVFVAFLSNEYSKLKSFKWKNGSSLATWIRVVTRNLVLDYIRKATKESRILQSANETVFADSKEELIERIIDKKTEHALLLLESEENQALLEKAFKELTNSDKQLVELLYFQNTSHEDAARILNKKVDAIYMQKKRVVLKIKEIIQKIS